MTIQQTTPITVYQDGREFYLEGDEVVPGCVLYRADCVRGDWDMQGAEQARDEFTAWCASEDLSPVWV